MNHQEIKLVLKMLDAIDKKTCDLRIFSPDMNRYLCEEGQISEYKPELFSKIRQLFGISSLNLTDRYIFNSKIHSNSGAMFFFTADFKYVIKTIRETERETFLEYIDCYYLYLKNNPSSFLLKIIGCYVLNSFSYCSLGCVPTKCTHSHCILIMKNLFKDTKIDRIYDLKGKSLIRGINNYIKKDIDWYEDNPRPSISESNHKQILKDLVFLEGNNVMDYSLIVYYEGIQKDSSFKCYDTKNCNVYKVSIKSDLSAGQYVLGIVDMLTKYNCLKRTEYLWNTFCLCKNKSSLNPKDYKERLIKMIEDTFIIKK